MPGLVMFGRRWSFGSDDLVVPTIVLVLLHSAWYVNRFSFFEGGGQLPASISGFISDVVCSQKTQDGHDGQDQPEGGGAYMLDELNTGQFCRNRHAVVETKILLSLRHSCSLPRVHEQESLANANINARQQGFHRKEIYSKSTICDFLLIIVTRGRNSFRDIIAYRG